MTGMAGFRRLLPGAALLAASAGTQAAEGEVVYYEPGCDDFIVEAASGYVVLEWWGGGQPAPGCEWLSGAPVPRDDLPPRAALPHAGPGQGRPRGRRACRHSAQRWSHLVS